MRPVDVAFTPSTRAVQARKGSREIYAGMAMGDSIDDSLAAFIAARDSFYLASASADGQPYIQHRGGPPGFLRVLDDRTLGLPICAATVSISRPGTSQKTPGPSSS